MVDDAPGVHIALGCFGAGLSDQQKDDLNGNVLFGEIVDRILFHSVGAIIGGVGGSSAVDWASTRAALLVL